MGGSDYFRVYDFTECRIVIYTKLSTLKPAGSRANPQAAKDAWERTLAWFEKYVRTS